MKRVVITGAAQGIGAALVEEFLETHHAVLALDTQDEALQALKQTHQNSNLETLVFDVTRSEAYAELKKSFAEKNQRPDVWINNAGITAMGSFLDVSQAEFDRVLQVNFFGVVLGTRCAMELMQRPEHGAVINIASLAGHVASPFMSAYAASKHAVVGFTRAIQEEIAQTSSPLQVMLVSPGFARTAIMQASEKFKFPQWLDFAIADVNQVAKEIVEGYHRKQQEVVPTSNGKMLHAVNRLSPVLARKSSRLLNASSWKELLGLKPVSFR
jgi:short-subunit dehydrogenase